MQKSERLAMGNRKLIGLSIIAVLVSVLFSEYAQRILIDSIFIKFDNALARAGDGPIMFISFSVRFICRPLIAGGCGALISLLSWPVMVWTAQVPIQNRSDTVTHVVLASAVVAVFWSACEYFWLYRFWP